MPLSPYSNCPDSLPCSSGARPAPPLTGTTACISAHTPSGPPGALWQQQQPGYAAIAAKAHMNTFASQLSKKKMRRTCEMRLDENSWKRAWMGPTFLLSDDSLTDFIERADLLSEGLHVLLHVSELLRPVSDPSDWSSDSFHRLPHPAQKTWTLFLMRGQLLHRGSVEQCVMQVDNSKITPIFTMFSQQKPLMTENVVDSLQSVKYPSQKNFLYYDWKEVYIKYLS